MMPGLAPWLARVRAAAAVAVVAAGSAGEVTAQVANSLPRAVGLGGSYTALARGLAAPAWNPAGLGMPGNPAFSITALSVAATSGLEPITLGDLADYGGELIPYEARVAWLDRIRAAGGEKGVLDADVTYLALSAGPVAVSLSSSARGRIDMAPDVAEVFFFGNAGLTGEPGDYSLQGSSLDVAATTTVAASFALPVPLRIGPLPDQRFALGATLKYTVGNFLIHGQESRSAISSQPLSVDLRFPVVTTPMPDSGEVFAAGDLSNGNGVGLDLGAAWNGAGVSAGLVVRNVFHTFEWDLADLEFHRGTALWNADTAATSFEEVPPSEAPEGIAGRVDRLYGFGPVLAAGAAARVAPTLTLTGEVRHALEKNLAIGARDYLGVGAQLDALPALPLQAGIALVTGGYQLSGGAGLRLGPVRIAAAGTYRDGDLGDDVLGSFGLTVGMP